MQDIWDDTYLNEPLPGLRDIRVCTALHDMPDGRRSLIAKLMIHTESRGGISTSVDVHLSSGAMRALAALLEAHAARIERDLMPLMAQPEAVATLYREPEAA